MISNFWKKITIFNAALLIIFLRIYAPLITYIQDNCENNSIFAKFGENGYPFKDSLDCDLNDINLITKSLINKNKENNNLIPITQKTTNRCSFLNKIEICNDNKECFEEINNIKEGHFVYHKKDEFNNTKIINNEKITNLIKEQNLFLYEKNNMIEISFFYKIIDGYASYLSLLSNDTNIIKQVTENENKMNNLLFLFTLYIKSYIANNKIKNNIKINQLLEYQEENIDKEFNSLDNLKKDQLLLIRIKIIRENVINCIPDLDTRYSFLIDFQSIYAMLQTLLKTKRNNINIRMFDFLFNKITYAINNIFVLDDIIKERSEKFCLVKQYFFYAFWAISAIIIYYCNKYFLRHKEFYKSKNRTVKNVNANSEYKKYLKYRENIKKLEKINRKKYTKEEIEMINKLTSNQKDYIISK